MVLRGHSAGSMHGYWLSGAWSGCGIQHDEAWRNRASDSIVCRMCIRSPSSARKRPQSAGCSVIRNVRIVNLDRRSKKPSAAAVGSCRRGGHDRRLRRGSAICRACRVPCIVLELEVRRRHGVPHSAMP